MRILHVIPFLWSGAGNVVTRLCLSQAATDDVAIVTSSRSKGFTDWPEYRRRLKAGGIRHIQIDFFDRDPAVFWQSVDSFEKLLGRWQPDRIHSHAGVPACAAALSGHPFVAQLHSWGTGRPEWMNTMDLWAYRRADRVICSSQAYRRILTQGDVDPSRIRYIPWGLDLNELRPNPPATDSKRSFRCGFLGRIEPRKGQLELVKAFLRFHNRHPESELVLVGPVADKEYNAEIQQFIRKAGLGTSVTRTGRLANPHARMSGWDLFASLSHDEGQGLAVLEAMALCVPVLARRVAGIEDYLQDQKTGLAVTSASAKEVADRMEWAFHHPQDLSQIAARARHMVETKYNWSTTLQQIGRVYGTFPRTHRRLA